MNLIPTVMVCNEERFITPVLTALASVFPAVIVADTGSIDSTLAQIKQLPVYLMDVGRLPLDKLGVLRNEMADIAAVHFGATHIMKVDGDECYPTSYLRSIVSDPLPPDKTAGFTHCVELIELDNGEVWKLDADFDAITVYPASARWGGVYPFEYPRFPKEIDPYYYEEMMYRYRGGVFYHLHHMKYRSSQDAVTPWRMRKQNQFALKPRPDMKLKELFLKSWEDYKDE